jgi:hypothetical protein
MRSPKAGARVFMGDLVDRGPDTPGVLRLVMKMVAASSVCPATRKTELLRARV